ncbi:MAG TPA: hypothetical protein VFR86_15420 [Burkholderiaceae bacterium]|nr:hypothetical protein [Burkholderiaceae bacterium]
MVAALVPFVAFVIVDESGTSRRQAALFTSLARELEYRPEPGPSSAIRFPHRGPYDERLGYHQLPAFVTALESKGCAVTAQARMSPRLIALVDAGFFRTYREKN